MEISKEVKLKLYENMLRDRYFEDQASENFYTGSVQGFVHLGQGEEAVPAGVCAHLTDADYLATYHRGHGHMLLKGADPKKMMAELCGRVTGYCKGKGGSQHVAVRELNIIGSNGIVGAGQALTVGAGLKIQLTGTNDVAVCFTGDGASNEGTFHESLNFASAKKLPVVYILLNNLFAISTKQVEVTNTRDLADRAFGYHIPGIVVDGNDVLAVYEAAKTAIDRARRGEGPSLIECKTYKWHGHFEGDPAIYRTAEEVAAWKAKDPILRMKRHLLENQLATEEELDAIDKAAAQEMKEAIEFALASDFPAEEDALKDVYTDMIEEGR